MALTAETVVVVVDSNIQRVVLATEKTTVTQQASHRTIKYQSRSWSQTGTKVNGSHHGDNMIINSFFSPRGSLAVRDMHRQYQVVAGTFKHTHFIPIVGVGKRGAY